MTAVLEKVMADAQAELKRLAHRIAGGETPASDEIAKALTLAGRSMADLVHHMAEDSLVGWGWSPGAGRTPAPGSQQVFGALIKAWADTGAACPAG